MEKLTRNGQAILCTIHQPSSLLFQRFDRLLLLAQGGKTVYFGDIGSGSETLVDYFVRNGGPPCEPGANPAEHMLEVIGAAPGSHTSIDWPATWRASPEHDAVRAELARLRQTTEEKTSPVRTKKSHQSFAAPFTTQLRLVANRCAQQYWRTPSYVYSKMALTVGCSLILGFSFFNGINTQQGLQNQMFGVFIFLFVVIQLLFQIIPMFVVQRTLYEARERQSKTYAWQAFVLSNIMIEMFWNSVRHARCRQVASMLIQLQIVAVFCFVVWYYPVGLYHNAEFTDSVGIRGLHTFLLIWVTFLFASSLSHMLIAGVSSDQTASAYAMVISIMLYAFCGILAGPSDLPRFWIFMYRVNPFTYLVSSLMSATLGKAPAYCADNEFQTFNAPDEQSCAEYMQPYIAMAGGYLRDPMAMGQCQFCQLDSTDMFLQKMNINWDNRWRDFGLLWVYVAFNTAAAVFLYWVARVPKGKKVKSG
jgi:ATP-binding cassette subfamily G (WHITE) protein 2 (PDR)